MAMTLSEAFNTVAELDIYRHRCYGNRDKQIRKRIATKIVDFQKSVVESGYSPWTKSDIDTVEDIMDRMSGWKLNALYHWLENSVELWSQCFRKDTN